MRKTTDLRRDFVRVDQAIQSHKNRADCFHRVRGRIYADNCVSTPVKQSFERSQKDSADVVGGVIGLYADAQDSTVSHRIAATRDIANLGDRGGDFSNDGLLKRPDLGVRVSIVQKKLAKFSESHASDGAETFLVECVQNKAGNVILGRVDQWATDNFPERQVRKFAFSRDSLAFRSRSDAS